MKKEIEIDNKKIPFIFRKSTRARMLRLTVYCDGNIVATIPHNISENTVEKFIKKKTDWIISKISHFKHLKPLPKRSRLDYLKHKKEARKLIMERIKDCNQLYNFSFNRISIKNQKTRWGSCSRKQNLNFNYKILFLPKKFADYIVVHELCHLKEFNHSQNFWNLVAQTVPNHKSIRRELKSNRL
ncbi:M48 family metallopeptidase [Candidatus Parcubacteria bacterium]|nr:M48 family metallopeptidase [Candidatus Parcubacteria bacterium]